MNSVPNSDSEQCTESKLSRVHSAPTHSLGCALRHVVAHAGPYRGPLPDRVALVPYRERLCPTVSLPARSCWRAVSQLYVALRAAPCRSPSSRIAHLLRRIVAHTRPYRSAAARHVVARLAIHPATRLPSYHDTPTCIATHPATTRPFARSPLAPREGRPCRRVSRPCRSVLLHPSPAVWRLLSRSLFFFHIIFFSFCSTNWKTTKKIYYFFYFPVEPNKFIKIYFI